MVQKKISHLKSLDNVVKGTVSKGKDPLKQAKMQMDMETQSSELAKDLDDCIETLKTVQALTRVDFMQQICSCMSANLGHCQKGIFLRTNCDS